MSAFQQVFYDCVCLFKPDLSPHIKSTQLVRCEVAFIVKFIEQKNPACKRTQRRSLCTEKVSVVFVQFFSRLKQEGEPVDRWEEPES